MSKFRTNAVKQGLLNLTENEVRGILLALVDEIEISENSVFGIDLATFESVLDDLEEARNQNVPPED
jgi:hypothetical protein